MADWTDSTASWVRIDQVPEDAWYQIGRGWAALQTERRSVVAR